MTSRQEPFRLAMPAPFPDDLFEAVKTRISGAMPNPSPEMEHLGHAHIAVRYRLRACADYSEEFTRSIQLFRNGVSGVERYQQDRQLFGFFLSGYAALDSFSFFMHFTAAHLKPCQFQTELPGQIKRIDFKHISEHSFPKGFANEPITTELIRVAADPMLKEWYDIRNILAHRAAPARLLYASSGSSVPDPAADWKIDSKRTIPMDERLTPSRLTWLVSTLTRLVAAASEFTHQHF
jgi:hypothetical protein